MNPMQQEPTRFPRTDAGGERRFRRLHALGRVGLRAEACLHVQKSYVGCKVCEQSCPHGCLTRGDGALELDPARCTACGLCAAACPTGALSVEGHGLEPTPAGAPVTVSCDQACVSAAAASMAMRRVPCLGGVTLNDYLRLSVANGGAPITVIDDGACEHCPTARGQGNPGLSALNAARRAMAAAGVPDQGLPQHRRAAASPNGNGAIPTAPGSPSSGRRAFFSSLSRALAGSVTQPSALFTAPQAVPQRPRAALPGTRGEETYLLLGTLARRYGRSTPREALLPQLTASDACRAHGACARACPTGAIELERDEAQATLHFAPWQCIACGACERICPEHALRQTGPAWGEFVDGVLTLTRVPTSECPRCGASLAAHAEAELCDRCDKSQRLAQAGFALFHPHKRASPAMPDSR